MPKWYSSVHGKVFQNPNVGHGQKDNAECNSGTEIFSDQDYSAASGFLFFYYQVILRLVAT